MDDEDFMDTDDMQTQNAPYEMQSNINSSTTSNDIMVTIPYVQNSDVMENRPFSFTIPNVDSGNSAGTYTDGSAKSKTNDEIINSTNMNMNDGKIAPTDRQYMIKIDNNDGTPPFPLSITLPHNLNPNDSNDANKIVSISNTLTSNVLSSGLMQNHQIQNNGKFQKKKNISLENELDYSRNSIHSL